MAPQGKRIAPIDGLRCLAALGVVWIHVWTACGSPIGYLSIYRLVSIVGNGVDFFFVISGFCMYLMYGSKDFSWKGFGAFIKKRWLRIAPPYYVAIIVYGLLIYNSDNNFPLIKSVFLHFLFLQNFEWTPEISGPLWSLATEWLFYLILPAFFVFAKKKGLVSAVLLFSIISIICGLVYYYHDPLGWTKSVWIRLIEFIWGMIIAHLYILNRLDRYKKINKWWIGLVIIYVGRCFILTEIVNYCGTYGFICKALGYPLMTLGFAIFMAYLLENQKSILGTFFSSPWMIFLGKISYSIYLWHSAAISIIMWYMKPLLPTCGVIAPVILFIVVAIVTVLISTISYKLLEEPYSKRKSKQIAIN